MPAAKPASAKTARKSEAKPARKRTVKKAAPADTGSDTGRLLPEARIDADNPHGLSAGVYMTAREFADESGLAQLTVKARLNKAGVAAAGRWQPKRGRGAPVYRTLDLINACLKAGEAADPENMRPFDRKAHYQAEAERLKLMERSGDLIPRHEVARGLADVLKNLVHSMEVLPDIIERDHGATPAQVQGIEIECDKLRTGLHADLQQLGRQLERNAVTARNQDELPGEED